MPSRKRIPVARPARKARDLPPSRRETARLPKKATTRSRRHEPDESMESNLAVGGRPSGRRGRRPPVRVYGRGGPDAGLRTRSGRRREPRRQLHGRYGHPDARRLRHQRCQVDGPVHAGRGHGRDRSVPGHPEQPVRARLQHGRQPASPRREAVAVHRRRCRSTTSRSSRRTGATGASSSSTRTRATAGPTRSSPSTSWTCGCATTAPPRATTR